MWDKPLECTKDIQNISKRIMNVDKYKAKIMFAPRLKGEGVHGLPQGIAAEVFHIDELPYSPESWIRDKGSYVIPVLPEVGIWFDFRNGTENDLNTAVVLSVKGMNPITGHKMDGIRLEQYKNCCPIHSDRLLGDELFCEKCGYKLAPQNYLCSDNPQISPMWIDGFRNSSDGKVRQFFFSAEDVRDVASHVIGKENIVPAFGFAFYKTKIERKSQTPLLNNINNYNYNFNNGYYPYWYDVNWYDYLYWQKKSKYGKFYNDHFYPSYYYNPDNYSNIQYTCSSSGQGSGGTSMSNVGNNIKADCFYSAGDILRSNSLFSENNPKAPQAINTVNKSVSIGAGVEISQKLLPDTLELDAWMPEPSEIIRLYFCFPEEFETIKRNGIKQISPKRNGFLENVPVG